jgi:hypothetical protein
VQAQTHDGRSLRILTLIDEHSQACLALKVARRINSQGSGEIMKEDLRRLCSALVWIRMDSRTGGGDWRRLLGRAFGDTHPRIASLYAAAGLPATKPDVR